MTEGAVRSAFIEIGLNADRFINGLQQIDISMNRVVKQMQGLDASGRNIHQSLNVLGGAVVDVAAVHQDLGQRTLALSGFFNQLDGIEKRVIGTQTTLGKISYGVRDAFGAVAANIDTVSGKLENAKWLFLGVSGAAGLAAHSMIKNASSGELYRLNIKALTADTAEGRNELNDYYKLISEAPDYVTKDQRTQLISQLKLVDMSKDQIVSISPLLEKISLQSGKSVDEGMQYFISGLRGQARSLRQIGITFTETNITDYMKVHSYELQNLTEEQKRYAAVTALFTAEASEKTKNFADVEKSAFIETQKFTVALDELGGAAGETLLPAFTAITKGLGAFINAIGKIPFMPAIIGFGTVSALMLALAGLAIPKVLGGLSLLTGGTFLATASQYGLITALKTMKIVTIANAAATWAWAAATEAVMIPLLAIEAPVWAIAGAVLGLLVVAQDLYTGLTGGKSVIMDFAGWLLGLYDSLGVFKIALGPIAAMIEGARAMIWVFQNWREIPGIISGAISGAIDYLKGLPSVLFDAGAGLFTAFIAGLKSIPLVGPVISALEQVRSYLPFSDAKVGPLADLTLSGQRLIQTFGSGAESQQGYLSSLMGGLLKMPEVALQSIINPMVNQPLMQIPGLTVPTPGGGQTVGQPAPIQVSVTITGNTISGDETSLQKFGSVTVDAVEKALDKIIGKQAISKGW